MTNRLYNACALLFLDESKIYNSFANTIYQVYLMSLVYNYEYEQLENRDKLMAQILVGAYLLLVSCIAINLFIALLSEAFGRVQSEAAALTYLVEARRLLVAEKKYDLKQEYDSYLFQYCSPLVRKVQIFYAVYQTASS